MLFTVFTILVSPWGKICIHFQLRSLLLCLKYIYFLDILTHLRVCLFIPPINTHLSLKNGHSCLKKPYSKVTVSAKNATPSKNSENNIPCKWCLKIHSPFFEPSPFTFNVREHFQNTLTFLWKTAIYVSKSHTPSLELAQRTLPQA